MHQEFGDLVGDQMISSEIEVMGMIMGSVKVIKGGQLILNGTIDKDLIIDSGAYVMLNGTVSGSVYNNGGVLKVYGRIGGDLHKLGGSTEVSNEAVIGERK